MAQPARACGGCAELGSSDSHKYTRGVVSVCGGGTMTGAARLSAAGARGAGAGLVRIAAPHRADLYRAGAAGLIVDEAPLATLLEDGRRRVWVCGPGLAHDEVAAALPALLAAGRQVVADAGALTEAAGAPERLRGVCVATPHAGEFARVFGDPGRDRVGAARRAARSFGGVLVLKGSDTVVAAPDGRVSINDNATPGSAPRAPATCCREWSAPAWPAGWRRSRRRRRRSGCTGRPARWRAPG